jgi:hypothetical protein
MSVLRRINERIVLLAAFGLIEIVAAYHSCVDRQFRIFIAVSVIVIPLAATIYWIDWIVRRGVTPFQICIVIGIGCWASVSWNDGRRAAAVIIGAVAIVGTGILSQRLLRNVGAEQQNVYLRAYRKEATSVAPGVRDFLSFVMFTILAAYWWIKDGRPIAPASLIYLPVPAWFLWRTILHLFIRPEDEHHDPISKENTQLTKDARP